jgi:hypothetical protein
MPPICGSSASKTSRGHREVIAARPIKLQMRAIVPNGNPKANS